MTLAVTAMNQVIRRGMEEVVEKIRLIPCKVDDAANWYISASFGTSIDNFDSDNLSFFSECSHLELLVSFSLFLSQSVFIFKKGN